MTFVRRVINLKFQLGTGDFGDGSSDALELTGLRCSADINVQGAMSPPHLNLRVMGMTLDQMKKLTVINQLLFYGRHNTVSVFAGDEESTALCFEGGITEAWVDLKGQPDAVFHVAAEGGLLDSVKPAPPTSFKGTVDISTILAGIAAKMTPPRSLEMNDVKVQLADVYYPGTLGDQIKAVIRAARVIIQDDGQTLAVYYERGSRTSLGVVDINPQSGMVGYPAFSQSAISVRTIFNPAIKCGMDAQVKSDIEAGTGKFNIYQMVHTLDSETPNGAWFTDLSLQIPGVEAPIPS